MKENVEPDTNVHKKKSQTFISTLNFHYVILFLANKAYPIARQDKLFWSNNKKNVNYDDVDIRIC